MRHLKKPAVFFLVLLLATFFFSCFSIKIVKANEGQWFGYDGESTSKVRFDSVISHEYYLCPVDGFLTKFRTYFAVAAGTFRLLVMRQVSGLTYTLIGKSQEISAETGLQEYNLTSAITISMGDVLGVSKSDFEGLYDVAFNGAYPDKVACSYEVPDEENEDYTFSNYYTNRKMCIQGYVEESVALIGEFEAPSPVLALQWFYLNCTIQAPESYMEFTNATIELNQTIILLWINITNTFSEYQDSGGYCTINASACIRAIVNSTSLKLSWRIQLSHSYPKGYIDVIDAEVYCGSVFGENSEENLFYFNPDCYLTFFHTEGGIFKVNDIIKSNGTTSPYVWNTVIEFAALPLNSSFVFQIFSWSEGSSSANPYNYTTSQNMTIWLYFGDAGEEQLRGEYVAAGLVVSIIFFPLLILMIWAVIRRKH